MPAYSFLDVVGGLVGPGGAITLGSTAGVAEEGITTSFSSDRGTMTIGADGSGMHSLHADRSGTISIKLLKTSPINNLLNVMFNLQGTSSALYGLNQISIRNIASGDAITGAQCGFKKHPDVVYSKDGQMLEWTFNAIMLDIQLGNLSS